MSQWGLEAHLAKSCGQIKLTFKKKKESDAVGEWEVINQLE